MFQVGFNKINKVHITKRKKRGATTNQTKTDKVHEEKGQRKVMRDIFWRKGLGHKVKMCWMHTVSSPLLTDSLEQRVRTRWSDLSEKE